MKIIGWIMVIISGLIILYNVTTTSENKDIASYNSTRWKDDPFGTILFGGANLMPYKPCYTFKPPYTGFEITVIVAGVIGLALLVFSPKKQ